MARKRSDCCRKSPHRRSGNERRDRDRRTEDSAREREELAALNERLAKEPERDDERLFQRELPDERVVHRRNGYEWLTVDGVPVKRRVVQSTGP